MAEYGLAFFQASFCALTFLLFEEYFTSCVTQVRTFEHLSNVSYFLIRFDTFMIVKIQNHENDLLDKIYRSTHAR